MAMSGRDVKVYTLRFLKFSLKSGCSFVKKHPFVSCTLLFFLVLRACFPSFFWILIYSLAFLILAASITRIYSILRNAKNFKSDEKNSDHTSLGKSNLDKNDGTMAGNEYYFRRARSVRRRKSRETSRDTSLQTSEDEKSTVVSTTFNDDMVDKRTLVEEKPKEIREMEVDSVIGSQGLRPEMRGTSYEGPRKFGGGDVESAASSEGTEEDDEHEREENNKAVQWNEDDQKNLMDLGFSEIERNKRLESLIARRRARKMSSLQARRSVMKMDNIQAPGPISSIMITRNNPFLPNPLTGQFSPMPGSAPSVLLPGSNPFDLPYDPHEERPNLTGGSFHLEFAAAHHRDLIFCRHESFSLGTSFPGEFNDDQQETSSSCDSENRQRGPEFKLSRQLDREDTDKIIEVESCQTPKSNEYFEEVQGTEKQMNLVDHHQGERSNEVQTKSILVEDSNGKPSSTSSSEEDVPVSRVDKEAILKSLASPVVRKFSSIRESGNQIEDILDNACTSAFDKNNIEGQFFYADKTRHEHTPTHSIASDLQVEVSEVSSPSLTIDGNISSSDDDFPTLKGDMESESTSGNEPTKAKSSLVFRGDENESRSNEIYEISEDNNVEDGLLRAKKSEDPLISDEQGKKVTEQDSTDSRSWLDSTTKLPYGSQDHPSGFHSNIEEDSSHAFASDTLAFPVIEKEQQLARSLMTDSSQNDIHKPEQLSYLPENSTKELSTTVHVDASRTFKEDQTESIRDTHVVACQLNKQEVAMKQTELPKTRSSTFVEYIGEQPEKIDKHQNILEQYKPVGKTKSPNISEDIEEESKGMPKQESMHESMPVADNDSIESVQVYEGERHAEEQRIPQVNQSYKPVGKTANPNISEDSEEESEGMPKQESMHESMPVAGNDSTESVQVYEGERHVAGQRIPQVNQNLGYHQVSVLVPEPVLERILVAPFTSSPRSVLQPKFSMDQSSLSNYSEDNVDIQQIDTQIAENSVMDESRGEGLISIIPQSTMLLAEDSISQPFHTGDAEIFQESSNLSSSAEEANCMGSQCVIHENGRRENQTKDISEGSSDRRSNLEATAAPLKPTEETGSRTSTNIDDRSKELHHHKANSPPASVNFVAQINQLNTPSIKIEEVSEVKGYPSGVSHKEEIMNAVNSKARASLNATPLKDSEHTPDEAKELAADIDRPGLLVLLETGEGSTMKYLAMPADETKLGFTEPSEGDPRICSAEEICEVELSKLIDKNYSSSDQTTNSQRQIHPNASSERLGNEVTAIPSTYEMVVSRLEEQSEDQLRTLKEALKD